MIPTGTCSGGDGTAQGSSGLTSEPSSGYTHTAVTGTYTVSFYWNVTWSVNEDILCSVPNLGFGATVQITVNASITDERTTPPTTTGSTVTIVSQTLSTCSSTYNHATTSTGAVRFTATLTNGHVYSLDSRLNTYAQSSISIGVGTSGTNAQAAITISSPQTKLSSIAIS